MNPFLTVKGTGMLVILNNPLPPGHDRERISNNEHCNTLNILINLCTIDISKHVKHFKLYVILHYLQATKQCTQVSVLKIELLIIFVPI